MISDEILRAAVSEVDQLVLNALPDPSAHGHTFSKSFERKMQRLIRHAEHPVVHRVLKSAAIFILVFSMLFAGLLVVSPEARASVVEWIKSVKTGVSRYFYTGEQVTVMDKEYYLSCIPEGYTLYQENDESNGKVYVYINQSGQYLKFYYSYGLSNSTTVLYTDNCDHSTVPVAGTMADLYLSRNEAYVASAITWIDPQSNILFIISAFENKDGLIQLAESVKEK